MGNARARGTYADRKASPQGRPPVSEPADLTVLAYIERGVDRKTGKPIVRRAKPGLYRDRAGRTGYRYDGKSLRRLSLDELAALTAE